MVEAELFILQTVKEKYAQAIDYRTYRITNKSPKYDDTVFRYIAKWVKKFKSQMRTHYFDPGEPILIINSIATFKLAYDTNRIREGATIWVLLLYVYETLANALNNRKSAKDKIASIIISVRINETRSRECLRS